MDYKQIIFSALAAIIALTVHEFCHGYAAYKLGDNTARNLGRLTFNPLKHLDPIGALCMVFFHVGWAKPVPINSRNFKKPKRDFAITAMAGPLVNILLGFFGAGAYLLLYALTVGKSFDSEFTVTLINNVGTFLWIFTSVNIGFGIFNLLPIPPFDGSRIAYVLLPPKLYFGVMRHERKIYLGVLIWLLLGDYVATLLRAIPIIRATPLLYTLSGVFSLSGMISKAIAFVIELIFNLWQLIPFLNF